MTLGETLKAHRKRCGLSQEKVAAHLGISRQAVTKWENNQTVPSTDNLIALAELYRLPLDELAGIKTGMPPKNKEILHTNLTRIAIIWQAAALNVCAQPWAAEDFGLPDGVLWGFKLVPLLAASLWMAANQRYTRDPEQRRKNARIELLYCLVQAAIVVAAYYGNFTGLGALAILGVCLAYIFFVNPRYMSRQLVRRK